MKSQIRRAAFLFIFLSLFCFKGVTAEIPLPLTPSAYVVDLAEIIDTDTEAKLNQYLRKLEEKTTAQMVVLTLRSLEGAPIEDLSINIAHTRWRLGQEGKDNGVLLLVALEDRKYRFEIGYGLEGTLPDSLVGSIGRTYLVPYFRKGNYSTGIFTASLAVIHEIASEAGVKITGMPQVRAPSPSREGKRGRPSLIGSIFTILFFIGLIYLFIKHPRLLLFLIMMNLFGGGRRGGWAGGGGFGGGGFGGGGGGGFGGGGASGGW